MLVRSAKNRLSKADRRFAKKTKGPPRALLLLCLLRWCALRLRNDAASGRGGRRLMIRTFTVDQKGATSIEYALIASLISIAVIGALLLFQGEMTEMFEYISNSIGSVLPS
ncbi:Flp family type IVb pilin [Pelagibacterium sp.]|uniref:Flp family type IVb pilin n=1 Tax=Pelagibacterium sp. TaxID=1967288 RepID=UPI003BACA0BC